MHYLFILSIVIIYVHWFYRIILLAAAEIVLNARLSQRATHSTSVYVNALLRLSKGMKTSLLSI